MQARLFLLRFLSVYIMYHKTNSTRNGIEFGLILKIQSFNFVSLESSKNWFNLDSFIQLIFQYDIQGGFKSVVIWLFFLSWLTANYLDIFLKLITFYHLIWKKDHWGVFTYFVSYYIFWSRIFQVSDRFHFKDSSNISS